MVSNLPGVYIEYFDDNRAIPIYSKNDNDIAANVEASARLYFKYKKRNYFLYSQVFKELDNISINGAIGIGMSFE